MPFSDVQKHMHTKHPHTYNKYIFNKKTHSRSPGREDTSYDSRTVVLFPHQLPRNACWPWPCSSSWYLTSVSKSAGSTFFTLSLRWMNRCDHTLIDTWKGALNTETQVLTIWNNHGTVAHQDHKMTKTTPLIICDYEKIFNKGFVM